VLQSAVPTPQLVTRSTHGTPPDHNAFSYCGHVRYGALCGLVAASFGIRGQQTPDACHRREAWDRGRVTLRRQHRRGEFSPLRRVKSLDVVGLEVSGVIDAYGEGGKFSRQHLEAVFIRVFRPPIFKGVSSRCITCNREFAAYTRSS
jgi:hypothetical protein